MRSRHVFVSLKGPARRWLDEYDLLPLSESEPKALFDIRPSSIDYLAYVAPAARQPIARLKDFGLVISGSRARSGS